MSYGLKAIRSEDGKELDTRVFKRREVHHGKYAEYGPDLFIYFDNCRWNIDEQLGHDSIYSYDTTKGSDDGGHGPEGFFAMAGPGVPKIGKIEGLSLLDVAPTILRLMNLPIPREMEGRVLLPD